ncbi:MAG: glycerol kinase GlpK [Planctomycetota bacterium]
MSSAPLLLAIDQGTTSTRAILFDTQQNPIASAQCELAQSFPQSGWVEHDPKQIWQDCLTTCREVLQRNRGHLSRLAAIGISNQRETVVLWDRVSGKALHPALVWQDRRTEDACAALRESGLEEEVRKRTGLLLDPYFSASKIKWLLDSIPGARMDAENGKLAVGTIDSWLLWHLTGGKTFATDVSNASRTLLFNITKMAWDPWLCELFQIPLQLLPEVRETTAHFGHTEAQLFGREIPIHAVIGDQQAATLGQHCFTPGSMKCTYGTGAFAMQNTGERCLVESRRLLTTVLWQHQGKIQYALEGSIFSAGSAIQWLRDGLGLFDHVTQTEELARQAQENSGVFLVPAFHGLGAPWWDPHARASLLGITRGTGRAEIVRAGLEASCFQTLDLLEAAKADGTSMPDALHVDGGLCNNRWFLQCLADILQLSIYCPTNVETTAAGAALCASLGADLTDQNTLLQTAPQRAELFQPKMAYSERQQRYADWRDAVSRTLSSS